MQKDVFLICSNAMRYNAPDTIYFRQARSIQEIAKKNFGNLRQDSNDNEQECKIARRGRPPTKNLNKEKIRHSLDHPGTELSVATLSTGAENTNCSNYDLRKGAISDKSRLADLSGHSFHGSRNSETCSVRSAEHKIVRNNEFKGFVSKGNLMKHGKKQVVVDENRRNSYKQAHLTIGDRESSVLTTFHGISKQLLTVGLHAEHTYGRSLACFAANVGPFAWKVASKKISKSLPLGINFGPGWIGVNEVAVQSSLSFPLPLAQLWPSQSFSLSGNPSAAITPTTAEMKCGMPSTPTVVDSHPKKSPFASPPTLSSSTIINRSSELITESAEVGALNSDMALDRSDPPFQIGPYSVFEGITNDFNSASGYNLPAQMGKHCGSVGSPGINLQSSGDTMSGSNSNFSP